MRWIWIDRIVELAPGEKLVAIKNICAGEDVLHDHFPAQDNAPPQPLLPHTLIIEGMAQTAGILVGHQGEFKEKVLLAKIGRASFELGVPPKPGYTLRYTAHLDRFDATGAATTGTVERIDPATGDASKLADIELMFSHIDQNRAGLKFPEENFVFTGQFLDLLREVGVEVG